jgi:hypothetical protein
MRTRSRFALVALAAVIAVMVVAVPAQAATVKSGSSQLTMGAGYVTSIVSQHITMAPVAPVTMTTKWNSKGNMSYWFRAPMVKKSSGKTSTWSPSTGKGTFYHSGSIRFVEASATAHKIFRAEGIRIIATSKTSYTMSVSYKTTAPDGHYERVNFATSTHATKITHSGKKYKITGVQFYLTADGVAAVESVLGAGEVLDHTHMIFNTDLLPVLQ